MSNAIDAAEDLDLCLDQGDITPRAHARALVREARAHDCLARAVVTERGAHALVVTQDGSIRAFRRATDLVAWLGY